MLFKIIVINILFLSNLFSQDTISVSIEEQGNSVLPADKILFEITINEERENPDEAFENHKSKIKILSDLLNDLQIPDSVIYFSLFRINKSNSRGDRTRNFRTYQKVNLVLRNFNIYDKLQIQLISKGFDNFSAQFISSNNKYGFELATSDALDAIRDQIDAIIKNLSKRKYKITAIDVKRKTSQIQEVFSFFANGTQTKTFEEIPQNVKFEIILVVKAQIF